MSATQPELLTQGSADLPVAVSRRRCNTAQWSSVLFVRFGVERESRPLDVASVPLFTLRISQLIETGDPLGQHLCAFSQIGFHCLLLLLIIHLLLPVFFPTPPNALNALRCGLTFRPRVAEPSDALILCGGSGSCRLDLT